VPTTTNKTTTRKTTTKKTTKATTKRAGRTKRAPKAAWTVMVFLNAKNDLEPFSFLNFEQMARVGSSDEVNVLIEFGRPLRNYVDLHGGWSKTLRFRVTKGMKPTEGKALEDLGSVNMGDGEALAEFVEWSRTAYPAERYLLAIWDHGQGWRRRSALTLRGAAPDVRRVASERRSTLARLGDAVGSLEPLPDDMRVHGAFRYVSHDEDTGDKLYNREIQDALTALTAADKIDVIGFDACLMGMIETAYALRRCGSVMVASEELEPGDGWDYGSFLAPLVADPTAFDAAALGAQMVTGYKDYYGDRDATTLSAVALPKVQAAARALTKFATLARADLPRHLPVIKRARKGCENYAPGYGLHSVDLCRFLGLVERASGADAALAQGAAAAKAAVEVMVVENYASAQRQGRFGSSGLAIYFPESKLAFDHDPDRDGYLLGNTSYPVEFVDRQGWAKFLHAYFDLVPR
jgi:hypothetical protein